jgi:gp32 DNA binding protein like
MATLDDIRKKLKEMESRKGGQTRNSDEPSLTYPFWNVPIDNKGATVRFLPDKDTSNTFFWRERQIINLTFPGIKGHDEHKPVTVKVPCVEMWGDTCPILKEIRPWWNDTSLVETARKYWKKRSYMFQALVIEDPLNEKPLENPIRRLIIGPQIFNIIKSALLDPDMENSPTDYINGTNFTILRTKKGEYNDFSTSKYARKESALTEEQLEVIEKHGLFNLNDWLPPRPDAQAINAIAEMFEASVNGDLYDPERWASYFRPYGFEFAGTARPGVAVEADDEDHAKAAAAPKVTPAPAKAAPAVTTTEEPNKNVNDILAKIRQRATQ